MTPLGLVVAACVVLALVCVCEAWAVLTDHKWDSQEHAKEWHKCHNAQTFGTTTKPA